MLTKTDYCFPNLSNLEWDFENFKTSLNFPTGNFFYDPWKIKPEFKGTIWESLLKSLPEDQGEARVIVMQPGTTYMAHADIDNRWHYNIQGEESYLIDLENTKMHLLEQDGYWYYMDAGRMHVASNYGSIPRIQLVVRELLIESNKKNFVSVTIKPKTQIFNYRYKFDRYISTWLNKTDKLGLLKDFKFKDEIVYFKTSRDILSKLNSTSDFEVIVE